MRYNMMYGFDPTYVLVLIGLVLSLIASGLVKSTFAKYSRVLSRRGITASMAAERILFAAGINDVTIRPVSGKLTDNYDPRNKTLNLSDATYASASVAAVGVAAHECGHAVQYAQSYTPMKIRGAIIPITNIGSTLSIPLFFLGLLFSIPSLVLVGIGLFALVAVFQLVTLPVEFNASSRALKTLEASNYLSLEELGGAKRVLSAAAMTYVAALIMSIAQLLRLIFIARRNDR